jgi:hypothetical protein
MYYVAVDLGIDRFPCFPFFDRYHGTVYCTVYIDGYLREDFASYIFTARMCGLS